MADVAASLTVTKVFQDYVKILGLREFPCGTGSWHDTCDKLKTSKKEHLKSVCSLLNADDATKEKSENLVDLITSLYSPWYLDYSWSNEAKGLREIAIKSPELINKQFVDSYFKTLKIVDKGVTEVDRGLIRLKNLEELTLSANHIISVNSKCLPPSLKVLELCANDIQSVSDLCIKPPPLEHLGLGRNRISVVGDYISGIYWPNLVSLDLSHNDFTGLIDIVAKLCTLPKLRNLLLQGNPVSLIPGYRGYVIDCLQDLTVFDDKHISFDEKHHFKGLAEWQECILEEAIVELEVTYIKGLSCPPEVMYPESQPEFPIVEKLYFVQFTFPVQVYGKPQETETQIVSKTSLSQVHSQTRRQENEPDNVIIQPKSNQSFETHEHALKTSVQSISTVPEIAEEAHSIKSPDLKTEDTNVMTQYTKLMSIDSQSHPWEEMLVFNWTSDIIESDLIFLRDFFKLGMDVAIVEQIIESYPAESFIDNKSEKAEDAKEKEQKDKKKNKMQKKETIVKPAKKEQGKDRGKKKKPPGEGLVRSPPKFTNVALFHVSLDSLLNGDYECRTILTKPCELPQTSRSSKVLDDMVDEKLKLKKKVSGKINQEKKSDAGKSPKYKKLKVKTSLETEDEELPCIPLEVEISVKLHHWLTVNDVCQAVKQSDSWKEVEVLVE